MTSKTLLLSNNKTVHYVEKGSGEPLVLLHGVGMQAAAWYPQIEYFSAAGYRVIAVDMPGHGASDRLAPNSSLQDFVAWAIEFLTTMKLEQVNLAGHSMGSLITLGVSVTRPDLIKRMAMLNGVYKRTPEARAAVQARAVELKNGKGDSSAPLARWFGDSAAFKDIAQQVRRWLDEVDLEGYATAYSAFANGDEVYANRWSEVVCPALILTGREDWNSTAQMAEQMAQLTAKGNAVVLDGERHMVNLTNPEQVNKAMQDWLNTK